MTASAPTTSPAPGASGPAPRLLLRLVPTPQPPAADPAEPVALVRPGVPVPRVPHRPGPRPRADRPREPDADFGPSWSARADLPAPAEAGRSVVVMALEVLAGRRPVAQLRGLTTPGLFASLSSGRRPQWCSAGMAPFAVGRVHVDEPVDGVAEISVVVRRAGRAHAVAARLEGLDGRWRCTALQIG